MNITKDQYLNALDNVLQVYDKQMLQAFVNAEGCKASSQTIAKILGLSSLGSINLKFGKLGRRISEFLDVYPTERTAGDPRWWSILADGEVENSHFVWKLKRPFLEALLKLGFTKLPDEELDTSRDLKEGAKKQVYVNAYERNRVARTRCIEKYGVNCQVCDMNFEETYGEIGKDFIHVHHLTPMAARGDEYDVDPEKDLIPVCPNCHAMLHKGGNPLLTIEELKKIINDQKEKSLANPL